MKQEDHINTNSRQRDHTPNSNSNLNSKILNTNNKINPSLHQRKRSFDSKKGLSFLDSIQNNQNSNGQNQNISRGDNQKSSSHQKKISNKNIKQVNTVNTQNFIKRFSGKSKAGRTFDGKPKTNQDSFLIKTRIFNLDNFSIFGVYDGHGAHGHFISNMIKLFFSEYYGKADIFLGKNFSHKFNNGMIISNSNFKGNSLNKSSTNNYLQNSHSTNNLNCTNSSNNNSNLTEDLIYEKLKDRHSFLIKNSFNLCESSISLSKYDANFSGSTCVMCFFIDNKIICANSGDSRAILITNERGYDTVINLSRDHKPDLTDELNRITRSNGRVDRYCEHGIRSGPFRVWLKNQNYPGLAMSRSIGDLVAGSVGVICDPEIVEYEINDYSKFIVIASDGIWEFLSNEKVMEIVNFYYCNSFDANSASERLVEEATKCWRRVFFINF